MTRILIAHSDPEVRKKLSIKVSRLESAEVSKVRSASRFFEEVEKEDPDVVMLGVGFEKVSGLDLLDKQMKTDPVPTFMISEKEGWKKEEAVKAFSYGAIDFVSPENSLEELEALIKTAEEAEARDLKKIGPGSQAVPESSEKIVVIGSSTGGPQAVEYILKSLPSNFPAPIVICQHMSREFTESFAQRLDELSSLRVKEAEDGDRVKEGSVYLSPGDRDTVIVEENSGPEIRLSQPGNGETPSIDKLFTSAAENFGSNTLGVVLTGMGDDGVVGARYIKAAEGSLMIQDKESSTVYGIASHIKAQGDADAELSLEEIPEELNRWI